MRRSCRACTATRRQCLGSCRFAESCCGQFLEEAFQEWREALALVVAQHHLKRDREDAAVAERVAGASRALPVRVWTLARPGYFICVGREQGRTNCTQRAIRIDETEEAVTTYYAAIRLSQVTPGCQSTPPCRSAFE